MVKGSLTGISIGAVTEAQKVWGIFQGLGNIAFAYSYSFILLEIQVHIFFLLLKIKTQQVNNAMRQVMLNFIIKSI